jgi:hypothetical protein
VDREDKEVIAQTLDALERLMRMFQAERIVYLLGATASLGLLLMAGYLMFTVGQPDKGQLALIFGAGGISAYTGGRIAHFLTRSFNLIEDVVRKMTGAGSRRDS